MGPASTQVSTIVEPPKVRQMEPPPVEIKINEEGVRS
jgi:hypothetical protein